MWIFLSWYVSKHLVQQTWDAQRRQSNGEKTIIPIIWITKETSHKISFTGHNIHARWSTKNGSLSFSIPRRLGKNFWQLAHISDFLTCPLWLPMSVKEGHQNLSTSFTLTARIQSSLQFIQWPPLLSNWLFSWNWWGACEWKLERPYRLWARRCASILINPKNSKWSL